MYQDPKTLTVAQVEAAYIPLAIDGLKSFKALERIRAILDGGPNAYDDQNIKRELEAVLGPFTYRTRKPCP